MKTILALVMLLVPLGLRAVTFTGQRTAPTEWTYTLTFAPLDNYSIFEPTTTITLTGLFGVVGAAGPTSTDLPGSFFEQNNTNWTAEVLNSGTEARWTHIGPGTGNWTEERRVFGFRVFATGAIDGQVSVTTSGFSRDTTNPLPDSTFDLDVTGRVAGPAVPADLPVILTQPRDQTVLIGGNATFTVSASGAPPLSYQWFFNDEPIPDATNPVLSLSGVTTNQAGIYFVVVANAFGSVASSLVVLSVRTPLQMAQQAYLKASNTGAGDFFGVSVAVSGDTVVVGASVEGSNATGVNGNQFDNTAQQSGAAYVFVRNGTNWTQQAYLKASNTGMQDFFGISVGVSGDTIVVGAFGEDSNATGVNGRQSDNNAPSSGAAYVFVRSGTNWTQQAYLKASNTEASDNFGASVAVSGDTVVVGASAEDSNATGVNGNQSNNSALDSGAAYVFVRSGTNWTQQAYLKASNTGAGDLFGGPVAVSGDTVVVGASDEDSNATGVNGNQSNNSAPVAGAAYVFVRSGTNWTQQAYLKASNTEAGDFFGRSVAVSGDTVVVGASAEDSNATGVNGNQSNNSAPESGAAYVFVRSGTNWTQQAYLKASNTDEFDIFGLFVAASGDTAVVGALEEDSNATGVNGDHGNNSASSSGAAYVFARSGTNWTHQAYLKASNTGAEDNFGRVAVSDDTVVVGAHREDSNATGVNSNQTNNSAGQAGAAYIFTGLGVQPPTVILTSPTNNATFVFPNNLELAASANGGSIAGVEFFAGGASLGTVTSAPYGLIWSNATPGDYVLTAVATDSRGLTATSAPVHIRVLFVNQAPSFAKGADQMVFEDAGAQAVANWAASVIAGPAYESDQVLAFLVSTDNPALFAVHPAISPAGTLTYMPAPNANGSAAVTVRLQDSGGTDNGGQDISAPQTFTISLAPVNDPPAFTRGADLILNEDAGVQTLNAWALNISPGAPNESEQTVGFVVTNNNPALFAIQPAISPAGTLTCTPAPDANGSATVTVRLQDSGGTDNGGQDTSPPQTFLITVTLVNDAPAALSQSLSVNEDTPVAISLTASDVDGDTLSYLLTQPSHGTLSGTPPHLTYTPAANYFGPDSFTFKASDGQLDSEPATVSLNVIPVNDPPVAAASLSPQVLLSPEGPPVIISPNNVDALVVFDASASSDVENDSLHFFWFLEGVSEPFATGMIVSHTFEVGEYAIILRVSDGTDVATTRLSLLVISPGQAAELLIALVDEAPLERKNKRPMIATLKAAVASFDRGDLIPALNQLRAFQNKVHAQISRDNPAEAAAFIHTTQLLLDQFEF